jgi:hypothetical protein
VSGSFGLGTIPSTVDYALAPPTGGSINGWELIAPMGDGISSRFATSGYICTNPGGASNVVECLGGTPLAGPFTGILNIGVPTLPGLSAAGTSDGGMTWGPTVALTAGG